MKLLIELFLFPVFLAMCVLFMALTVLAIPLKIPFINTYISSRIDK